MSIIYIGETMKEQRQSIKQLLDEEQALQGQINEIDKRIQIHESRQLAQGWTDGNIRIGWAKKDLFTEPMKTPITNRDRLFSLSSITSRSSNQYGDIENEVLLPHEKARFHKKNSKTHKNEKRGQFHIKKRIKRKRVKTQISLD